jgi:hypothetical protein
MENYKKLITRGIIGLAAFLLVIWLNPWDYNESTERSVVTQQGGKQFVEFSPGFYYAGIFARINPYPNQIGVQYKSPTEDLEVRDNTVDIGKASIQFLGGASATVTGIAQFNLPNDERSMLDIHNSHRTVEGLIKRRLAPYTQECLSASAQLLTPEMHYNGGKAQMTQDYLDQLKYGSYLLEINKVISYDSIEKANKSEYIVRKQLDKSGISKRKFSSIKEYNITVGDAQITTTEYEPRIVNMLGKQIDAATAASVARQQLMTAQQQALTAKAQGEKKLVETEYAKKVDQTNQVVAAETKVKLAEQYKFEQKMASEAAIFAGQKVRTDADADAYAARQAVAAGLTPWDRADFEMKTKIGVAAEIGKMAWPTTYINGGGSGNQSSLDQIISLLMLQQAKK